MARSHAMTPARRKALKKAQAASARKRRGKGKGKLAQAHRRSRRNGRIAAGVGIAAVGALGAGYGYGKFKRNGFSMNKTIFTSGHKRLTVHRGEEGGPIKNEYVGAFRYRGKHYGVALRQSKLYGRKANMPMFDKRRPSRIH
jgi:hypothetical protein